MAANPTPRRAWIRPAATAFAGFALGFALFGIDDIPRMRMWTQDAIDSLMAPKIIRADEAAPSASTTASSLAKASRSLADAHLHDPRPMGSLAPLAPPSPRPGFAAWTIPYWIDPSASPPGLPRQRAIATVRQAADSWNSCGARFEYQGEKAKPTYGLYGPGEKPDDYLPIVGWMRLSDDMSGLTQTESDDASGQIKAWSMELDPERAATSPSLLATASHEFGHIIGIDHSRSYDSIMFGGPNPKILKPSKADLAECRRILSSWSEALASGMARPAESESRLALSRAGLAATRMAWALSAR